MDSISVGNFRCFQSAYDVALRPITFLIGENSTGKSSFLAATRLAWDAAYSAQPLDFNEEPFLLGTYDQIAHYRGGKAGRAKSFEITSTTSVRAPKGLELRAQERVPLRFRTVFGEAGSHPVIESQTVQYAGHEVTVDFSAIDSVLKIQLTSPERKISLPLMGRTRTYRFSANTPIDWSFVIFLLTRRADLGEAEIKGVAKLTESELSVLNGIMAHTRGKQTGRPVAIAPVRSRPKRTYNPISAAPLPEGDHVPMVLAKTFFEGKDQWDLLKKSLHQFGVESGLFDELDIKALGRSESEPFQLKVKIQGPSANLVDVGYGVSQVLPILVDSILARRGETFLIQQPEVHLHPRAQAALGSFLVRIAKEQGKRFIVESHSDYLMDRVRTHVREKTSIRSSDLSLLYFNRTGLQVDISNIAVNDAGEIVSPPEGYRSFFLQEERRVLGV